MGGVGLLLLYYYIGPCGQSFEAQIHMRFFTRTVVCPHKKRVRLVSCREGNEVLTESATSETLTSVWNYFRVSTCERFFRLWYGWQFVDGVVCGGFHFRVRSIHVRGLPVKVCFGASFRWGGRRVEGCLAVFGCPYGGVSQRVFVVFFVFF